MTKAALAHNTQLCNCFVVSQFGNYITRINTARTGRRWVQALAYAGSCDSEVADATCCHAAVAGLTNYVVLYL
jgi:hypothetical protein